MDNHSPCGTLPPLPSPATRAAAVFVERGERIKMAAEMGLARSSRGRHWSRALRRRILRTKRGRNAAAGCGCEDETAPALASPKISGGVGGVEATAREEEEEEEEVEVEKRVRTLQKLVPGGEELGVERLFEETADYIEALQGQVSVMRTLAVLLDGLEREKRMAGGG